MIDKLSSTRSSDRRAAAKFLRKNADICNCSTLINALKNEVKDSRTWETQYHIAMAIGESNCKAATIELELLLNNNNLEPMVRLAIADAFTRISKSFNLLESAINIQDYDVIEGSLRAAAIKEICIPDSLLEKVADSILNSNISPFWLAAASAKSKSKMIMKTLQRLSMSKDIELAKASKASLNGKFLKWSIL